MRSKFSSSKSIYVCVGIGVSVLVVLAMIRVVYLS